MTIQYSAYAQSLTEQSITNTSYSEYATLDFTAPALGDYLIIVTWDFAMTTTTYTGYVRVQLDDATTITLGQIRVISATNYVNGGTFYRASSLASGAHYIDLDAYVTTSGEGLVRNIRFTVIRLDDALPTSGMYFYWSTEASTAITQTSPNYQTIVQSGSPVFTPDTNGNYLVLACGEFWSASASYSVDALIYSNTISVEEFPLSNTEESAYNHVTKEADNTVERDNWLWGGIMEGLASTAYSLQLRAQRSSASAAPYCQYNRLFTVRLGALGTVQSNEATTVTSTTNTTYSVNAATITFTPASLLDYIILGGLVQKPDGTTVSSKSRINHSAGTSTEIFNEGIIRSKDAATPADAIPVFVCSKKSLAAISQTISVQPTNVSSATMYYKGALIIAFPVYTETPVGYSHDINAVVSSSISSSNEIPTTSISSFNNVIRA